MTTDKTKAPPAQQKKAPSTDDGSCAETPLPQGMTHQAFLAIRNNLYVWLIASVAHLNCVINADSDQDAVTKMNNLLSAAPHSVTVNQTDLTYFVKSIRGYCTQDPLGQQSAFTLVAGVLQNTPSLSNSAPAPCLQSKKAPFKKRDEITNPWSSGSTHPELGELDQVLIPNQ